MKSIGLDIGTTTICGILMDAATGELIRKMTLPNDTACPGEKCFERLQDPRRIEEKCFRLAQELYEEATDIVSMGVTGQMHGILYLDENGNPVSPLMSWQDERGEQLFREGKTYAEELSRQTGYDLASGFGAVTHFYNTVNGLIPENAVTFCTIADYIALRMTGRKDPLLHPSMAASLGLFQMETGRFDEEKITASGMELRYFPMTAGEEKSIGTWKDHISVSPALGDNQASFLGAVDDKSDVLVNVGTGSQVSILGDRPEAFEGLECRPFIDGKYLYVGCALCGGSSYSLIKTFFESVFRMCDVTEIPELYEFMNQAGRQAKTERTSGAADTGLTVDTRFQGSRKDPALRGRIEGLSPENFRAGELVLGVLEGIAGELSAFYREYEQQKRRHSIAEKETTETTADLTGSGNGIRRNPLLQEILCEQFGRKMRIPACAEEAAYGSALFSLYTAGIYRYYRELRRMVR